MEQQLVPSQTVCMEQNDRYGGETDLPKLFGFISAFRTIIKLNINDAPQDWSYGDKILAWLVPKAFKRDIEDFYRDKAQCLSELFKKDQLKSLDLSLCKLFHHRITSRIFNELLPLYKQLLSDEQKYSKIISQLNSTKYTNKQNAQIFIKYFRKKLLNIEERAYKKCTKINNVINLFMRSFCLSTNDTTCPDKQEIDTYCTSNAVDKLTRFLKLDTKIELLAKEKNSTLKQKPNSRVADNIGIRKLERDIDSLQLESARMMYEIFYFFYQIKPEWPSIKDISNGNEKFKIPSLRDAVTSEDSLPPEVKYTNPPASNRPILNKQQAQYPHNHRPPHNNCMNECVLKKDNGGGNDFLSMSLVDLVSHLPVSVRLRNAIIKAANLANLPFNNIGEYLNNGRNARLAINKLPNVGQRTSRELDNLIKKVSEQNYAVNGEDADDNNILLAMGAASDKLAQPPNDISLLLLPIFSSKNIADFSPSNLNPAYRPFTRLADLDMPVRITHILRDMGIQTIGEVMLTSKADFLSKQNFGFKSIRELQDIVRSHCLFTDNGITTQANDATVTYSDYKEMVLGLITQCEKNERNQQLFLKRFCFQDGKPPTLEELGCSIGITRERARQILLRGIKKLQKKVNIEKLAFFWNNLDRIVNHGGGLINLGDLPTALQNEFHWPTAPNSLALGQFLLLRQPNETLKNNTDLFRAECECLDCEQPRQLIHSLDFEANESFHIQVIAAKLGDKCQTMCPWHLPAKSFHRAFVEDIVAKSNGELIIHNNLVMPYDKWRYKYSENLEDAICSVLEAHGSPMHFRKIADSLRRTSKKFVEIGDHNVHAAVMRYDTIEITGRGTYGLESWGVGGYRSVSTAIEEFIDARKIPQRKQDIFQHLTGEFSDANINASLTVATRFINIGDSFYDRTPNWRQSSCREFIQLLPDSLTEFGRYLISKNNTSYKLVMAFIFIRSMDANCAIYIHKLKELFYNFYLSRHKRSLPVEVDTAIMYRIGDLSANDVKNRACSKPLKSFINSDFFIQFSQDGRKLALADVLMPELSNIRAKNILVITLLKAIDDYFRGITADSHYPLYNRQIHNEVNEPLPPENNPPEASENESSTISIRKKGRGKIKL